MDKRNLRQSKSSFLKTFLDSTLSYFFPPLCLHCKDSLPPDLSILCRSCFNDLELLDLHERCPICFEEQDVCSNLSCKKCSKLCDFFASCFPYQGASKTLLRFIKEHASIHIIDALSAFMVIQFQNLDWEMPDLIVSPPQPLIQTLKSGFNQNKSLGFSFAKLLSVPYVPIVKFRTCVKQRNFHAKNSLILKNDVDIIDKKILLVDYVRSKEGIFSNCIDILKTKKPKRIYGLTICF